MLPRGAACGRKRLRPSRTSGACSRQSAEGRAVPWRRRYDPQVWHSPRVRRWDGAGPRTCGRCPRRARSLWLGDPRRARVRLTVVVKRYTGVPLADV